MSDDFVSEIIVLGFKNNFSSVAGRCIPPLRCSVVRHFWRRLCGTPQQWTRQKGLPGGTAEKSTSVVIWSIFVTLQYSSCWPMHFALYMYELLLIVISSVISNTDWPLLTTVVWLETHHWSACPKYVVGWPALVTWPIRDQVWPVPDYRAKHQITHTDCVTVCLPPYFPPPN